MTLSSNLYGTIRSTDNLYQGVDSASLAGNLTYSKFSACYSGESYKP